MSTCTRSFLRYSYSEVEYSTPSLPLDVSLLPQKERYCPLASSDTDNDRDASSTCLSDSFLAVCSHNQSDEDLAMSIKYRGVPFRLALINC